MINSFNIIYKNVQGISPVPSSEDVIKAGEIFILHLPEAGRSDKLFRTADHGFFDGIYVGDTLVADARNWSGRTNNALSKTEDTTPDRWAAKKRGKTAASDKPEGFSDMAYDENLKEELNILEDLRLLYREQPTHGKFLLRDLPVQLGEEGPIDGDIHELLKDALNHEDSVFLIEDFLCFDLKNQNVHHERRNGETRIQTDEVPENSTVGPDNSESKNCIGFARNMKNEEMQMVQSVAESLSEIVKSRRFPNHKVRTNRGSAAIFNLGNTCFASCALQYFHCVPELKTALTKYCPLHPLYFLSPYVTENKVSHCIANILLFDRKFT